jgi:ABC-type polysaccharide/polyol phosphate export permease
MLKDAGVGAADIRAGLVKWRIWVMLARNDVRRRYRRSVLGQFWLTLSMAFTIAGMGYIYSGLFGVDVTTYLPYLSVSFVMWTMFSSIVVDSCTVFGDNESLLRHMRLPRSLFVYRVIARTLIVAAHNLVIIPIVFAIYGIGFAVNNLWFLIGFPLVLINGFFFGFFLAVICARFRDVPQIVVSLMQIAFFVTPVMFQPEQLLQRGPAVLRLNPFASLLEIVRDPLLGHPPSEWALLICAGMAVVGILIVVPFVGRYSPRAIYWL